MRLDNSPRKEYPCDWSDEDKVSSRQGPQALLPRAKAPPADVVIERRIGREERMEGISGNRDCLNGCIALTLSKMASLGPRYTSVQDEGQMNMKFTNCQQWRSRSGFRQRKCGRSG